MTSHDSVFRRSAKRLLQAALPPNAVAELKSLEFRLRHRLRLPYEAEAELLRRQGAALGWIPDGATVLDVGSNIGQYAALFSELVGPAGTVHAFEPMPHVRRMLERNLRALGCDNVRIHPVGASDRAGGFDLFTPVRGGVPFYQESSLRQQFPDDRVAHIETVPLDALSLGRVAFAKFDIEGAEFLALQGAAQLLADSRPVLMLELEERFCARFGHASTDIGRFLEPWGYVPHALHGGRLVPIALGQSSGNVLFLPPDARRPA